MPPIIIAGAIAGGAALFGAHEQSSAAKSAAQDQENAANKALDFNKQIYTDQVTRETPYMNLGTQAMQGYQQYAAQPFNQRLANLGQPYSPATAAGGAQYNPAAGGNIAPPPAYALGAPQGQQAPAPGGGIPTSGMVPMIGPNGEQGRVPASQVPAAIAKGAKLVNQAGAGPMRPQGPQAY